MGGDSSLPDGGAPEAGAADGGGGMDAGETIDAGPAPDAPICSTVDADGDGFSECTGDCDDSELFVFPGAPEVCGDGLTNDCGSADPPDAICGGIGTFVAEPPTGDPLNPGTRTMPVDTIARGIANAMTIGGGVDVYVAEGTYQEDVALAEGISLWGAYDTAFTRRDPAAHVSRIRNTTAGGVLVNHGITRATAIDGFTIEGLDGVMNSRAITVAYGAAPVISNNVILGPDATNGSFCVDVNATNTPSSASPLIQGNDIVLGKGGYQWGTDRGAWGIRHRASPIEIRQNRFLLPDDNDTIVRGIELGNCPSMTVEGNTIRGTGQGWGVYGMALFASAGDVWNNDIDAGRCVQFGNGLALDASRAPGVRVWNNIVFGGADGSNTNGLVLDFESPMTSTMDALIHSNFLHGGFNAVETSAGVYMSAGAPVIVGRFYNNIIYSGTGRLARYAFMEARAAIDPELLHNNALHVMTPGSAMTAALYRNEASTNLPSITAVNALTDLTGGSAMNRDDDCAVTDPVVDGDFHLSPTSMCIDRGSSAELPALDFEDDTRPAPTTQPDIGPDETG